MIRRCSDTSVYEDLGDFLAQKLSDTRNISNGKKCRFPNLSVTCFSKVIVVSIVHFTVVCLVTWPLNGGEAGVDLVLIQTLLLFICKCKLVSIRTT